MSRIKDLTGQRFGRLVVVEDSGERKNRNVVWRCKCDCGNETFVSRNNLASHDTLSCGCIQREITRKVVQKRMSLEPEKGTRVDAIKPREKVSRNNKSGVTGVSWSKKVQKWQAQIKFKGQQHFLGYFTSKQDAINARKEAEEKYFKPIIDKYGYENN